MLRGLSRVRHPPRSKELQNLLCSQSHNSERSVELSKGLHTPLHDRHRTELGAHTLSPYVRRTVGRRPSYPEACVVLTCPGAGGKLSQSHPPPAAKHNLRERSPCQRLPLRSHGEVSGTAGWRPESLESNILSVTLLAEECVSWVFLRVANNTC